MSLPQDRLRDNYYYTLYYFILLHTISQQIGLQHMRLYLGTYARNLRSRQLEKYLTSSSRSSLVRTVVAHLRIQEFPSLFERRKFITLSTSLSFVRDKSHPRSPIF
jgi:hypothetical protein